ncbi:MAG TPA: HdeD family acid-resistance protein [Mycobacterium sp.]|nr:HdeD family acid-resistance protein [Mycobacterium sp.]HTX98193.1 HdeD family acid-resistance protein [Mycobacterium sp.]
MTTTKTPTTTFEQLWKAMLVWGLLTVALGVVVLVWPGKSIVVASALFGAYLLISGIAEVVLAFTLDTLAGVRLLWFIGGALSVVLAVLAFRHFGEGYAILLLAIWIGVSFVFQGTAETATAISYPDFPGRGWYIFLGIITAIAGVVVLAWPYDSIMALALVTGIWLVIVGIAEICASVDTRKATKQAERGIKKITPAAA